MARDVFCVSAEVGLDVIADLLADANLDEVAVVDSHGVPIGIVGRPDLASGATAPPVDRPPAAFDVTFLEGEAPPLGSRTAADVMRPVAVSLHYRTSIATAAAVQMCRGASRMLVVDDRDALCGIVTAEELARWQSDSCGAAVDNQSP
jgi:CBS-domain-containing membrane protein